MPWGTSPASGTTTPTWAGPTSASPMPPPGTTEGAATATGAEAPCDDVTARRPGTQGRRGADGRSPRFLHDPVERVLAEAGQRSGQFDEHRVPDGEDHQAPHLLGDVAVLALGGDELRHFRGPEPFADGPAGGQRGLQAGQEIVREHARDGHGEAALLLHHVIRRRSEEHTSELQSPL